MIAVIAPATRVIDISHGVERHDVRTGALVLRRALPYFPAGVHLAVVDPEVGGDRNALFVSVAGQRVVAPDNGCWTLLAEGRSQPLAGGRATGGSAWPCSAAAALNASSRPRAD